MTTPRGARTPQRRLPRQTVVGVVLGAGAIAALLAGRRPVSALVAVLCIFAYAELRGLLAPSAHRATLAVGAVGVGAFLWAGYRGRLSSIPLIAAVLTLAILTILVVLSEATGRADGATQDVSSTLAASAVVGIMGAHILLIRSIPRVGFRGLLAFGLMVLLNDAFAFFGGRAFGRRPLWPRLSPNKTTEGAICGFLASVVVGLIAGFVLKPPFDPKSALAFGVAIGVLAPVGDLVFSAIKRAAARKESGGAFGPLGGALDAIDSLLFCAPLFYWAFRTVAL